MAEENIQGTTPENTPSDTMDTFIESITDNAQKKAFRETLNEDGSFSREKIRDLAGRYLSERRAVSKLNEMPETAEKFKESYKPDDKFAPLFNEERLRRAKCNCFAIRLLPLEHDLLFGNLSKITFRSLACKQNYFV